MTTTTNRKPRSNQCPECFARLLADREAMEQRLGVEPAAHLYGEFKGPSAMRVSTYPARHYVCDACGFERAIRTKAVNTKATPSQLQAFEAIKAAMLRVVNLSPTFVGEIKDAQLGEPSEYGTVYGRVTVGYKGDEGTWNEVYSRRFIAFAIGPLGAVRASVGKDAEFQEFKGYGWADRLANASRS